MMGGMGPGGPGMGMPGMMGMQGMMGGISSDPIPYRSTSPLRNTPLLGPYSRTIPRVLWWS